ncbi:hypothetical protein LPTSP4_03130 [Leptospira ryugenii]|uniref:Methionyl-tRNA formyltransferase n=1 Tax=Leptospira ryugenii TaxID=1917863 RepID=A0A2P2DW08_9LEPT|nr:formyltransferase family protein [Leptospira ryugenii]GBF48813.1 hypothetical protein LPTSP4_03130 [Leptospira ryugenii]
MKIIFIGSVIFSKSALEAIIELGGNVVGIVTKNEAGINADYADLTNVKSSIPFHFTKDVNSVETIGWIRDKSADVIFCFGWSSLIKTELLQLAPLGVVGFHPAELPRNRGRHPIIWALVLGLTKTASTFFFMDEGADSGDILNQRMIKIEYEDDALSLYNKITQVAISQIKEFLPQLSSGNFPRVKQDASVANTWRKRGPNDGKIDFRMGSNAIYNLVRALSRPYVGSHVEILEQQYKVWKVKELANSNLNIEPGKVLERSNNTLIIKTGDGAIELIEHELPVDLKVGDYIR